MAAPFDPADAMRLYHEEALCLRAVARALKISEKRLKAFLLSTGRPMRPCGVRSKNARLRLADAERDPLAFSHNDPAAVRASYQRLVDGLSSMSVECRRAGVCNSTLSTHFRRLGLPPRARGLPGVLPGTIMMRATCLDPEVEAQLAEAIKRDRAAVVAAERVRAMRRREEGLAA